MYCKLLVACGLIFLVTGCHQNREQLANVPDQNNFSQIPRLEKQGTATRLVADGKPFLLIAGELHNSTCGGFEYMRPVWAKMASKNLNTVIATVSWELVEPEEGKFNFALVDSIIAGARKENLKLVLIWFGSWKNGGSVYIPSWVKKDYIKYPRAIDETGKSLEILSTFGNESCEADKMAFTELMRHIRKVDSDKHTVVMIQVENEMGLLDNMGTSTGNARRDFREEASKAFNSQVPSKLIDYLISHKENLFPELYRVWEENGFRTEGSWEEVFGKSVVKPDEKDWQFYSYYTEELFSAWNYAGYVEKIAAAGKNEYPLPMYVNAWLKQPATYLPGRYPSGGPLPQVLDIWRAAAPSIDFIAPDIYIDDFTWVCREFVRSGNPLFIPEARGGSVAAARAFYVFGEHDAGCFAPFGIDNAGYSENDPLDESYAVLKNMSDIILANQGKGIMKGILVDMNKPVVSFKSGNYTIEARLSGNSIAGGLLINTAPNEFIAAGKALDIFFFPEKDSVRIAVESVDEGLFDNGKWVTTRRLNGDEVHASTWSGTGLKMPNDKTTIQKLVIYEYK